MYIKQNWRNRIIAWACCSLPRIGVIIKKKRREKSDLTYTCFPSHMARFKGAVSPFKFNIATMDGHGYTYIIVVSLSLCHVHVIIIIIIFCACVYLFIYI